MLVLLGGLLSAFCCPVSAQVPDGAAAIQPAPPPLKIKPMTDVNVPQHLGYFGDPYPIHFAPWVTPLPQQFFSGTTPELLQCDRPIKPGCFSPAPLIVNVSDGLRSTANAAGNAIFDKINYNIFQTSDGTWQMAVTLFLWKQTDHSARWTVITHAHPDDPASLTPPTSWVADTVLVGSLTTSDFANYDGKYFEDNAQLYLVYSKRLITTPVQHDGIVAQAMTSPSVLASGDPVVLLDPNNAAGGFDSEFFHTDHLWGDSFKLIETGNITNIAGKYVMAYSVGDYQQLDYKTGLAYSDTFLPQNGGRYRKVLQEDTAGAWGPAGRLEVRYLLQSQKAEWPNYVANQVIAPGVPSIVQEPSGRYLLYFDGFLPGDTPPAPLTPNNPLNIEPDHRRPFFLPLNVQVPYNIPVSAATNEELSKWITPRR